jgi:hypothetical protein
VLAAFLNRGMREPVTIDWQEGQPPKLVPGFLYQHEPAGGPWLSGIPGTLKGFQAVGLGGDIEP